MIKRGTSLPRLTSVSPLFQDSDIKSLASEAPATGSPVLRTSSSFLPFCSHSGLSDSIKCKLSPPPPPTDFGRIRRAARPTKVFWAGIGLGHVDLQKQEKLKQHTTNSPYSRGLQQTNSYVRTYFKHTRLLGTVAHGKPIPSPQISAVYAI